ncbi:peptidoglycan DD-metalloendopeptidase family protein [Croceivirga thetidis]|uniref:Peptidoglycan DD-metalloendopeptidase family protein n=1 Tax=Croceivirga thetidis TaxID=2721623 RepID=A0ABX1GNE0_9FLAO|nr:peptidoglycan DD-metalloendopeptidase family protein [Croceivirga thetidis]NKI31456.1 peptidoglycan DD-metalloendopeptidase family protein [Croceivirga thetidis]
MRKYWGVVLALVLICSCKETKEPENQVDLAQVPVEEPIPTRFGFDFDAFQVVQDTVRNGDSFGELMLKNHVDYDKVLKISENYKDTFDVRMIKVGKPYFILNTKDSIPKAQVFIYQNDKINYTVVDLRDSAHAYKSKRKVKYVEREIGGTIKNSLSLDMDSLGVDYLVTINLSEIYAWSVDFFKLDKGDKFKVIYDERFINDSIYAGVGPIKAAYFKHRDKEIYAFPFVTDSVQNLKGFYDQDAKNLRSTFLKAPIKFGYRLSSRYNLKRRIAYYGYKVRPHRGTDYAAPVGTPIIATANGTVTESTRRGGNGKYVKIRHNSMYSTQYLHMRAQNVKKGDLVRQGDVIGWVGMTGNTSGPHVCYRFWKNGAQVDPLREDLPRSEPIADSLRTTYFETIEPLKFQLDCIEYANPETLQEDIQLNQKQDVITQNQPDENQSMAEAEPTL